VFSNTIQNFRTKNSQPIGISPLIRYAFRYESSSATGTRALCLSLFSMSSERTIVDAIKVAQYLLWQNLPSIHNLSDAATVLRFRELVQSPAVRLALERSSDTLLAFALRAVERVLSDQSQTHRDTINRLWDVLDDPYLNKALGLPQNSRITFGPYPRRPLTPGSC
jgi:hypothetical protein